MIRIEAQHVRGLLENLLGRDVRLSLGSRLTPSPETYRGLVNDDDELRAVIAGDPPFARQTAAALAMIPMGVIEDGSIADAELMEIYSEVANVLSRVVNEASIDRLRLDPSRLHSPNEVEEIIDRGDLVATWNLDISGYGQSQFGIWVDSTRG